MPALDVVTTNFLASHYLDLELGSPVITLLCRKT